MESFSGENGKVGSAAEADLRSEIGDEKGKEAEALGSTSSSPSLKKGVGLRKWRRIPRDGSKHGDISASSGKEATEEFPVPVTNQNPTKRGSGYSEKQRKGDVSFTPPSSTAGDLGGCGFILPGVSQNGQEQIHSPAAVTAAKMSYEIPLVVGFEKARTSSGGKNKARIQGVKKPRAERAKIEKGHRSSNGVQAGENGGEVTGSLSQAGEEIQHDHDLGADKQDILPEDEITKSSWVVDNVGNQNHHGFREDHDPFAEAMLELQTVQESLEKELLMLREISNDGEESVSESGPELRDMAAESEEMLIKKIEAHVLYTVLTGAEKEKRSFSSNQVSATEEQKHIKSRTLKKGTGQLKKDTMKMQKRVLKLASYFMIQLLLLLVVIRVLVFQSSSNTVMIVPT